MSQRIYIGDWDVSNSMRLDGEFVYSPFPLPFEVELLVVGGGGGGGVGYLTTDGQGSTWVYNMTGGGGAGGMVTGSFETTIRNSYTITVGNGGAGSKTTPASGQNSSFIGSGLSVTAYGGGAGGYSSNGANGGSGGGGYYSGYDGGSATIGSFPSGFSGFGNVGGNARRCDGPPTTSGGRAGGGGGAGGAGSANNTICQTISGNGLSWIDGVEYARGGGNNGSSNLGNNGWGGDSVIGFTPSSGVKGASGIVKLRYRGLQKATGGTITQSDGYTYHTFTSSDTFEVISTVDN